MTRGRQPLPAERTQEGDLLRFIAIGSVDDGKSTLIGRLLYESRGVFDDQLASVEKASPPGARLELAFITDGLRAEREQGITIDVAYRYFATPRRRFIIADAPGHEQYTRNMVTGASTADLALILIDARKGVLAQTRRHACLAWLLGIRHFAVVVNKLDLTGFRQDGFDRICGEFRAFSESWEIHVQFLPISALQGDNVVSASPNTTWYSGPALLEYLETVLVEPSHNLEELRLPVQYVLRQQDFRGYAGPVLSGVIRPGDPVMVLPSGRVTRVARLCSYDGDLEEAFPPMPATICLAEEIDVSRGDMLVSPSRPPVVKRRLEANLVWMGEMPLQLGQTYLLKCATQQVCGMVMRFRHAIDIRSLKPIEAESLALNDIGVVEIETHRPLVFDAYRRHRETGAFILIDLLTNATVAAGMISGPETAVADDLADREIQAPAARQGITVWFTGLSGAGKTTLSRAVAERLASQGYPVEILDGDVVRNHLSKGLGFSREDRDENIRRIGFVARLLTRNGVIVLVSAVSPFRATRDEVRRDIGSFIEVWVNAPLEVCEQRDPKGLYRQAREGKLRGLTGIDDPYESPLTPDLECRTDAQSIEQCTDLVMQLVAQRLRLRA